MTICMSSVERVENYVLVVLISLQAQMIKNPPAVWESWVQSLDCKDPLEEGMATYSSILAWKIPMDRSPRAAVHGVVKSQTRPSE